MSGTRCPILRHGSTGVPLPWWDARVVPLSTLLDYLGTDRGGFQALVDAGCFAHPGCQVVRGKVRPVVCYVPAVVWARNHWTPDATSLAVLAAGDAALADLIRSTRTLLDLLEGRRRHQPPQPIPFAGAAIAATAT